ncbi:hypothetical protein L2E82_10469 [Cichorium intybus]|uniref:Uncharacterized protein n=1 Tax=Cichorium intybus TaxID=13427 RepID=A0ACB9GAI0_CICIN|nr:hypothetical protein L2E82_10469 [Cichorium intybus]
MRDSVKAVWGTFLSVRLLNIAGTIRIWYHTKIFLKQDNLIQALSPWDMIGSFGVRNFMLCKKPQKDVDGGDVKPVAVGIMVLATVMAWKVKLSEGIDKHVSLSSSVGLKASNCGSNAENSSSGNESQENGGGRSLSLEIPQNWKSYALSTILLLFIPSFAASPKEE